ncbi:hypothetical protein BC832DRAFT_589445 [Gaertneriomyces semiglobifer]|nr:hypothetical protein BC832DRAFT_589445 [Gaertneriomyces semiglobifer]
MTISILVTTAESRTGDAILAEFARKYAGINDIKVTGIIPTNVERNDRTYPSTELVALDVDTAEPQELERVMKEFDTAVFIPPASETKVEVGRKLIDAATKAGVKNMILLSDCCVLVDPERSSYDKFKKLEDYIMSKRDSASVTVVRAGHYMQNLLFYAKQMKQKPYLGLPIGKQKLAPIDAREWFCLSVRPHDLDSSQPMDTSSSYKQQGDVGMACLTIATSGKHMDHRYRGQFYVLTGLESCSGEEIVAKMKKAGFSDDLKFKDVPEQEARNFLMSIPGMDESEVNLLIEDFRAVKQGKLDLVSKDIMDLLDERPTMLVDFFKEYKDDFLNPQ